jgi:RHS repeat-associated protein
MSVCEPEFLGGTLRTTRVNFLGARGIEAVVTRDHTRGNQASLSWLLYDGHGNLVRLMAPNYTLSGFQWRGVWGEVQGSLGTGRGYCANLGHPEDETGLVYMRARYYEPATGRFISEDPARDGVNWYLYADGNPVNMVDADGQNPIVIQNLVFMFIVWWQFVVLNPKLWDPNWQPFLNTLLGLGTALIGTGLALAVSGATMIKAAEIAYKTPTAKAALSLTIQGMAQLRAGVAAIIAGGFLLYSYWYGSSISSYEELQADAGILSSMIMNAFAML